MKPRLIILIVAAAGLAVAFAVRSASPPSAGDEISGDNPASAEIRDPQKLVWEFELAGDAPEEEAEFDVNVRVDTSTGKNRLVLDITEVHGYYVEYIVADIWYVGGDELDDADYQFTFTHRMNRYLRANETLVECLELVPRELSFVGGSIGSTEDWAAEITNYNRARAANPESFPPVGGEDRCSG